MLRRRAVANRMREDLHPGPLALQWSYARGGYRGVGVQPNHVKGLRNNCRNGTAITALILARAFGNSPDLWLNVQRCSEPREV
jgi:plasmid maintenance system antidote protein VapI